MYTLSTAVNLWYSKFYDLISYIYMYISTNMYDMQLIVKVYIYHNPYNNRLTILFPPLIVYACTAKALWYIWNCICTLFSHREYVYLIVCVSTHNINACFLEATIYSESLYTCRLTNCWLMNIFMRLMGSVGSTTMSYIATSWLVIYSYICIYTPYL